MAEVHRRISSGSSCWSSSEKVAQTAFSSPASERNGWRSAPQRRAVPTFFFFCWLIGRRLGDLFLKFVEPETLFFLTRPYLLARLSSTSSTFGPFVASVVHVVHV